MTEEDVSLKSIGHRGLGEWENVKTCKLETPLQRVLPRVVISK